MVLNLRKRVLNLEGGVKQLPLIATYDLRLLPPQAVDLIWQFRFCPSDDHDFLRNTPLIADLLRECEIEPIAPGITTILPEFPPQLQTYWRHQRFVNEDVDLPHGNYDFRQLSYTDQARFQILCHQYGWELEAGEEEIAPLFLWEEDDLSELFELLESAIPESEKAAKRRRVCCVDEV